MGLSLLAATIRGGVYKAPVLSQAIKDTYNFRHLLHRFAGHVNTGEELTKHEEECLKKLGTDCSTYLTMKAYNCSCYEQLLSALTDIIVRVGMPQVSQQNAKLKTSIELHKAILFDVFVILTFAK